MQKAEKIKKYLQDYGLSYTIRKVYYRFIIKYLVGKRRFPFRISRKTRQEQEKYRPRPSVKISLVTALYNTPEKYLREMLQSVVSQTYGNWELCLVDASDTADLESIVKEYGKEKRIRYKRLSGNKGISDNTNEGFAMAKGDYVGIVDHDDLLHPSALYEVVQSIQETGADLVYTDELSFVEKTGRVQSVHLKNGYSPEVFCSNNYICHFTVFRKKLLKQTGMFRKEMDGAQDYDLFLRLTGVAKTVSHVSKVLYYWRIHNASSSSGVGAKPYVVEAGKKALEEHLSRRKLDATVSATEFGPFYHVQYQVPSDTRILLIVEKQEISFSMGGGRACFSFPIDVISYREILKSPSLLQKKQYDSVILVRDGYEPTDKGKYWDNGSDSERTQNEDKGLGWMEELVSCLVPETTLVASPVVVDDSDRISHGGFCYDREFPELIRELYTGVPICEPGYMNHLAFRQSLSLLGGAALAVEGRLFQKFCEPARIKTLFSESAWFQICLMAQEMGGECILTPHAVFRGQQSQKEDMSEFLKQWEDVLSKPDPHLPEQMKTLGKYYFYY